MVREYATQACLIAAPAWSSTLPPAENPERLSATIHQQKGLDGWMPHESQAWAKERYRLESLRHLTVVDRADSTDLLRLCEV